MLIDFTVFSIISILMLLFFLLKLTKPTIIIIKSLFVPILTFSLVICIMIYSDIAVKSAIKGINLWLYIVFPSLFPFFVCSEILSRTGFIKSIGVLLEPIMRPIFKVPGCSSFALAMGISSGYPVGAKIVAMLFDNKLITKIEAERLIAFTNNSGPLFIMGAVSVGMLNTPSVGFLLLSCHILASLTVGFIFRFYPVSRFSKRTRKISETNKKDTQVTLLTKYKIETSKVPVQSFGEILGESVKSSVSTILGIGGFIILFSVIIAILIETNIILNISNFLYILLCWTGINKEMINALLCGIVEITTGSDMVSKINGISYLGKLIAISSIIGWSGLCVHAQVISIIKKSNISSKPYFIGKFFQAIFASCYMLVLYKTCMLFSNVSIPVFNMFSKTNSDISVLDRIIMPFQNCFIVILILVVLSVVIKILTNLKKHHKY